MLITKIFTVESSHRVPGCNTVRCGGLHGHSYKFEICLDGSPINHANMVLDFSVLKDCIKPLIDSFDHTHMFCEYDESEYVEFVKNNCNRWISSPFNWSCEMMALTTFRFCELILENTIFSNGETPKIHSVTVWETATGRCEVKKEDVDKYFNDLWIGMIGFSDGVIKDWTSELKGIFLDNKSPKKYFTKKAEKKINYPWM